MAPAKLIELEQAREAVLARAAPLEPEQVPLREALGRVLAEDAAAAEPVPAFDNSAMDGFAVRAADTRGADPERPVALRVVDESRAGHPAAAELAAGEAIRISTGAMIPAGADAVVRVEDTRSEDGSVLVAREVESGKDVRSAGEDIEAGARVLARGTPLGPAQLGVLASLGKAAVACHRRPRVAVLTSGDELLAPDEPMRPGGVRDTNGYSVPALALQAGAELLEVATMPDDPVETREAIGAALEADALIVCGGVSVGEHDHVKRALADLGVNEVFWGVALRPGKPTWFGTREDTLVFGLPGNPVSAMVTFILLARPALAALRGDCAERLRTLARLAEPYEKPAGRAHAVRCRLELRDDGWRAHPTGAQGSHILTSMLGADCLALIPGAATAVEAGEPVEVELLNAL